MDFECQRCKAALLSGEIGDGDEVLVDVDQAQDALSVQRAVQADKVA